MLVGVGTDIVEIERVGRAYQRPGFAERIYTERERELIDGRASRAAGTFAVKEAVVKALGVGFGRIQPIQIEVLRDEKGRPYTVLWNQAKEFAKELLVENIHVSISNEREYAVAFAVAETAPDDSGRDR